MKKALALILLSALLVSQVGCGGKEAEQTKETETKQTESSVAAQEPTVDESGTGNVADGSVESPVQEPNQEEDIDLLEIYLANYSDSRWSEETNDRLVWVDSDYVYLGESMPAKYDNLANTLVQYSKQTKEGSMEYVESSYEDIMDLMRETGFEPGYCLAFYQEDKLTVTRADGRALSLLSSYRDYSGGAHGYYALGGVNFDSITGERLKMGDVVKDMSALPQIIYDKLCEKYEEEYFFVGIDYLRGAFDDKDTSLSWNMDYQGITFFFNPYEIASFADGILVARIPFAEYPDLFNPYYTEVPKAYSMGGGSLFDYEYDYNGDGKQDQLGVWASDSEPEWDYVTELTVYLNDEFLSIEVGGFDYSYYIVHTAADRTYLYIDQMSENDYHTWYVVDLNSSKPKLLDHYDNVCMMYLNLGDYEYGQVMLTNPDEVRIVRRLELLSTYEGKMTCSINDNGQLVEPSDWYDVSFYFDLVSKADIAGKLVDDYGMDTGKDYVIPAGATMSIIATNNVNSVDVSVNGKRVRLQVNDDGWPQTINGVDIYELFEELFFAG